MIRLTQVLLASLLLLTFSSQSEQQTTDNSFLMQILPALISASRHKEILNAVEPEKPSVSITATELAPFQYRFEALISPLQRGSTEYTWSFGDGQQAQGISSMRRYEFAGEYSVQLEIRTASGSKYYARKRIDVRAENKLPVSKFSLNPSNGHAPLLVQFDASASFDDDGEISSYHWMFGDGSSATGMKVVHEYQNLGIYTRYAATLKVIDDRQGQHKTTQYVRVNQADTAPVARFTMNTTEGTAPFIIMFDASESSDADGHIVEFLWDFGDGHVSSGKRTRHTYTEAGQYHPSLRVTDNSGDIQTISRQLIINPENQNPSAVFSISSGDLSTPATITFNASDSSDADGSIVSNHWDFGDGQVAEGVLTTHIYTRPGDYTVTLFVTDEEGGIGIVRQHQIITGESESGSGLNILSSGGVSVVNPYMLRGLAQAGHEVQVYVEGVLYQVITADGQGEWALPVFLQDGLNNVGIQVLSNAHSESQTLLLKYENTESRNLSGKVINDIVVLTPGIPPLPYVVNDANLTIAKGGKLVLQRDTEIQFNGAGWPALRVNGILDVRGEMDHKVLLTSDYLNENGSPGKWSGVHVSPEATDVMIRHAVIDQTNWAVISAETPVTIEDSLIRQGVIELVGTAEKSMIIDSQIEGFNSGLSIYGDSYVIIQGNTFTADVNSIRIDCYASGCPIVNMSGNNLLMDKPIYLHDNYLRLLGHQPLDVRGNWWGSTDIHQIGDLLLDTRGFLDGPVLQGRRFTGEIFDQQGLPAPVGSDLTLRAGNAYFAYSDITVPRGVRLMLEAGATLRLDSRYSNVFDLIIQGELVLEAGASIEFAGLNAVRVEGGLFVNGSEQRPVIFTSVQNTPGYEDWVGIRINSEASNIQIDHALIQNAFKGVSFSNSSGVLSNSELRDNKYGVWIEGNAKPVVSRNTITANETGIFDGISESIEGFQAQISHNNLQGNQQYAVYLARHQGVDKTRFLRENWWGNTDINAISEQIFDGYDASNHAFVDYSDYLDGPVPDGEIYQDGIRIVSQINTDTTLTANEHLIVVGDVYIAKGATLTLAADTRLTMPGDATEAFNLIVDGALVLEAGAGIEFAATNQKIEVNGSMIALGTLEKPVIFSSSRQIRSNSDWQGIHVRPSASHFELIHAQINNARRGIWFEGMSGEVHNSLFEHNELAVLVSGIANPDLQENTFNHNAFDVQVLGSDIDPDNQAPVAEFVSSREAGGGALIVRFNAGSSTDDGEIIAYHWAFSDGSDAAGSEVSLDFLGADEREVELTVLDEHGATGQISRTILYSMVNSSPVADAGVDQTVREGDQVSLDATKSHDDTGIVVYSWSQIQGPMVLLSDAASSTTSFTMPELDAGESLIFKLSVTDTNSLTSVDVVTIAQDSNLLPLAVAGRDQSVEPGLKVFLDGAFSMDPDGEIIAYRWVQSDGLVVDLLTPETAIASFTMPDLAVDQSLVFELSVTDNDGRVASDQVVVSRPKDVTLDANVRSGIAPLNVSFRIDSKVQVAWVNLDFDGDGSSDISQAGIDQFSFRYELPGVYQPYAGIKDDQGEWHFDRMTIVVSDPTQEKAAIKLEWDAMMLALLAGNIESAMHYYSDQRRDEFAYMFGAMGGETIQAIFEGVEDIQLNEVSGGYAEITIFRRQNGQLYAYPVGMIKDQNGVWKILKI